jgi:hypothetical protein
MTAAVQISGFAASGGAGPSLLLPGLAATPSARELADETVATLRPGSWQTRWRLDLPPGWCPPETADVAVRNAAGSFRQTLLPTDGGVEIGRRVDLRSQRVDGEELAALDELSGAEHRTLKRRLRFGCPQTSLSLRPSTLRATNLTQPEAAHAESHKPPSA